MGCAQRAFVEFHRNQAACGVALVGAMPRAFELHHQLPRNIARDVSIAGQGEGLGFACFADLVVGFLEKAGGGFNQVYRRALRV